MQRINYLDGHRGIAILLVIFFHAFSRRPELMLFDEQVVNFPAFKFGYLGVQLFFLISGFVILMTLEKCDKVTNFIYRRWLRLFPAMLICSIIIYFTAGFFTERPNGQPAFMDIIPGLTFIEPYVWFKFTGMQLNSLEGAFWSLYVEFKFYIVAALLYFLFGAQRLVFLLFGCFLLAVVSEYTYLEYPNSMTSILYSLTSLLSFKYFGWFAAGAAYFLYVKSNQFHWFAIGGIFSIVSAGFESQLVIGPLVAALVISAFFAASIVSEKLQVFISNKFFLFLGFVSYPLYLLHENMMISMMIKFDQWQSFLPSYLLPIIAIGIISSLSYLVSKYMERPVKGFLMTGFSQLKTLTVKH